MKTANSVLVEFPDKTRKWRSVYYGKADAMMIAYNHQNYFITQDHDDLYHLMDEEIPIFYMRNPTAFKP